MSNEQTTNNQQPITNNKQPTTNNQQPITNNQQPITNNQQPTTNTSTTLSAGNQQPITNNKQPTLRLRSVQATNNKFTDRFSAGEELAELVSTAINQLESRDNWTFPIVYALPRGGIPVALPIARKLGCPLDVVIAKKIVTTTNPELAIGAVTNDGNVIWSNPRVIGNLSCSVLQESLDRAQAKARSQELLFADYRPQVNPKGAIAILVDDGIATGMTIFAAALALKENHQVAQVWIASPVVPRELLPKLKQWSYRLLILKAPSSFLSVSRFYVHFGQVDTQSALDDLERYNCKS